MALTSQDVTDCVNALNIDKPTFTAFLQGAVLLASRNKVLAQIDAANAAANTSATATAATIAGLRQQLAAIDAQYQALVGG